MSAPRPISEAELNAYVDGELTGDDRAELEARLAGAPAELGLARDYRELNEAIAARYAGRLDEPVPRPMLAALGRVPPWRPTLMSRQASLAVAVLIALTAGVAGYLLRGLVAGTPEPEPTFVANAIGAHNVYLPEVRHPVEVKAGEDHLIGWLTKRVGVPIRAPALTDRGWQLMGGRLLPDLGLPAAQFMYEDAGGRRFSLYIRKETGLDNASFQFVEHEGLGAFYWIDRPLAYALAGRLSRDELMALAHAVHAQLEQR